jgi:hypothetical protein
MTLQEFLGLSVRNKDLLVSKTLFNLESDIGLPFYTGSIESAWEVVEFMRGAWDMHSLSKSWVVYLATPQGPYSDKFVSAAHESFPMAVCIAALKAKGIIENEVFDQEEE